MLWLGIAVKEMPHRSTLAILHALTDRYDRCNYMREFQEKQRRKRRRILFPVKNRAQRSKILKYKAFRMIEKPGGVHLFLGSFFAYMSKNF